jgi:tetratricopeptide (TPR) repeat protein
MEVYNTGMQRLNGTLALMLSVGILSAGLPGLQPLAWGQNLEATRAYNQAIDRYNRGNKIDALRLFERAAEADPAYPDAHYNVGSLYFQMQDYARAKAAFRKVLSLNPNDTMARFNLGLALEKLQQYDEAIAAYRQIPQGDKRYEQAKNKIASLSARLRDTENERNTGRIEPGYGSTAKGGPGGQKVETFAKGFYGPTGLAVDYRGDLYVANYSKNMIMRVSPKGEKSVFLQESGLHGPLGLAIHPSNGDLYVANYLNNNVLRVTPRGKVTVVASGLSKPYNLLLDSVTNMLFVTEQETNAIYRIQLN